MEVGNPLADQDNLHLIKQFELELLDEFLRICKKYDLQYFLAGGSCLGAVRHGGFIPWDDDIDIGMPREDYDRFCEVAASELDDRFTLQNYHTEPNCGFVFGKIRRKNTIYSEKYSAHLNMSQGVWIDLFPYDVLPDEENDQKKLYEKIEFWKNLYIVRCGYKFPENGGSSRKVLYRIAKIVSIFFSKSYLINKIDGLRRRFDEGNGCDVIPYGGAHSFEQERLKRATIEDYVPIEFEGRTCNILADYDTYLTDFYGDYMKLPPESERGGFHNMLEFRVLDGE